DGRLAVAERIPHDTETGQPVIGAMIVLLIRRIARIARENQTGRRRQGRRRLWRIADLACQGIAHAERFDIVVGVSLRQVRFEPQPEIETDVRTQTPPILNIETVIVRLIVIVEWPSLSEIVQAAGKEIGVAETGRAAHRGVLSGEVEVS